jgi:ubiquinone/menaquinone biosynthesis C-methylase UbiE
MKVAGGLSENGVVIGNTYDKYGSKNPIVKWIMAGFDNALSGFVSDAAPQTIHEVGCGEGFWAMTWAAEGKQVRGTDFSSQIIRIAKANATRRGLDPSLFEARSIYDLEPDRDGADLIVCCEVLEHVEEPDRAMKALQRVVGGNLVLSVPREPLWCVLNMARGKYLSNFGNTPGHINHWSASAIRALASRYFDVVAMATPLPWTMLHCKPKR